MTRRYRVRLDPAADLSIDDERAWWERRDVARAEAVVEEVEKAYAFVARFPFAGALIQIRGRFAETARFLVLDRINCLLFYDVDEERREVLILLLWHEGRRPPKLKVKMQPKPRKP